MKTNLKSHHFVHTIDKLHSCEQCEKSYKWKSDLKKHLKGHVLGHQEKHCDHCAFTTKYVRSLKRHITAKHIIGLQEKRCDHCAFTTKYTQALKRHITVNHDGIKFECNMCDTEYLVRDHLRQHKKKKHDSLSMHRGAWKLIYCKCVIQAIHCGLFSF